MHSGESSSTIRVVVVVSNWGYLWFVPITGVSNYVIYIWDNLVLTIDIAIYLFLKNSDIHSYSHSDNHSFNML